MNNLKNLMKMSNDKKLVTRELAELAEKVGFSEDTQSNWWILAKDVEDKSKEFFAKDPDELDNLTYVGPEEDYLVFHVLSCPTKSDLQTWLRDEKGVKVWCYPHPLSSSGGWSYEILFNKRGKVIPVERPDEGKTNLSYEEALEIGLKYALLTLMKVNSLWKRPLSGCPQLRCSHGSFVSSAHPCYKGCKLTID